MIAPLEQAARQRRGEVDHDRAAAGRLSEDRHRLRIAAEGRDIALDPLQRGALVHVAIVAVQLLRRLGEQRRMREEAEPAHPVVHADDDDTLRRERVGRIKRGLTVHERAAVNPHHHRQRAGRGGRTPDIERQAVLRLRYIVRLHALRAELGGVAHALPVLCRLRRSPAQVPTGGAAYGMPLKPMTPFASTPRRCPLSIRTTVALVVPDCA